MAYRNFRHSYWWEYLRRHQGYKDTCAAGGIGEFAKLCGDFGDIHSTDFWTWWRTHNEIFAEPPIRQVRRAEPNKIADARTVVLSVPLDTRLSLTAAQFRRLIEPLLLENSHAKTESAAKYPVETKPFLPSLHEHLLVWDARQANSETPDAEMSDAVGLRFSHVVDGETVASRKSLKLGFDDIERVLERRKKLSVQRYLRIAEQYIHYTGKGRFPLRYGR